MKLIETKEKLLELLVGNLSIISSSIYKFSIYGMCDSINIDVELQLAYKKHNNHLLLRFLGVQAYSFYYQSNRIFYNVEIFKFFKMEDFFYISFDPINEENVISDDDQDFIKSLSVEGYYLGNVPD